MKTTLRIFLTIFFLAFLGSVALAGEKIVQLTVPGCSAWGHKARISSILKKIDGITKYENKDPNLLIITFDDKKTTLKVIINELKKAHFTPTGEPEFLK